MATTDSDESLTILWNPVIDDYEPGSQLQQSQSPSSRKYSWVQKSQFLAPPSLDKEEREEASLKQFNYLGEVMTFSSFQHVVIGKHDVVVLEDYTRETKVCEDCEFRDEYLDLREEKKRNPFEKVWEYAGSGLKAFNQNQKLQDGISDAKLVVSLSKAAYGMVVAPNPLNIVWRLYSLGEGV